MTQQAVATVRRIFEHKYTAESIDEVLPFFHPEVVYHPRVEDPEQGVYRGRDAWHELISGYVEALSEITFEVVEIIDVGEQVIACTVLNGSGSASGLPVSDPYVFVYAFRDGLIYEGWEFRTKDEALALTLGE